MVSVVTNVTSLTRSGLADFLIQRVTAVIIGLYALCVAGFFVTAQELSHAALMAYFGGTVIKLFSVLAVISTAAHAWIGMWTVGTDYIRPHYFGAHATAWRLLYQAVVLAAVFVFVVWTVPLFWSL